jgi:hypothetical protein
MQTGVTLIAAAMAVSVSVILYGSTDDTLDLSATTDSQRLQNDQADAQDLSRMNDDAMVRRFRGLSLLVPVRVTTPAYYLHSVPAKLRYARPWTRLFLDRLGRQFHARFGTRLRVTGLVRTVQYQRALDGRNANAAPASGEKRSTHLTGATLDISKRFMSRREADWMRRVLSQLRNREVLYAIEEFSQPCFHVMVYRSYDEYVRTIS